MNEAIKVAATAAATALLSYYGWVAPNEGAKAAQDQCCPIARECVEALGR